MTPRKPGPKTALSRDVFVRAALAIVDAEGLDALSMRRLGAEVGVDPMAAYRHFPNKDALLDGVVEAVIAEVDLTTDPSTPWRAQIEVLARAYRAALLAHPSVAPLAASRPLGTPGSLRLAERSLEVLESAGVARHAAILAVNAMGIFVNGVVLVETGAGRPAPAVSTQRAVLEDLPAADFPRLADLMDSGDIVTGYDEILGFGLGAVTASLETEAAED
jgi:TetR/AcrR family transcriptional regulator, tetracycline repressor protein